MLLWLATALALAAIQDSNINRINLLWLPVVYFAAVGLRTVARNRFVSVGSVAVHLALFAGFASTYFGAYRDRTASAFFPSFGQAINAVLSGPWENLRNQQRVFSVLAGSVLPPHRSARVRKDSRLRSGGRDARGGFLWSLHIWLDHCPATPKRSSSTTEACAHYRPRAAAIQPFSDYTVIVAKH